MIDSVSVGAQPQIWARLVRSLPRQEPQPEKNNVRTGFIEREQFESVRKHLSQKLTPRIKFAYIMDWRICAEAMPFKRPQVDFEASRVRFEPGTTENDERESSL